MSFHAELDSPPLPPTDDLGSDGAKRQRISRACDRCRRKKVKCDGQHPTCTHCEAISASCTYFDTAKKRGPPKGYIDAIEGRLHAAEGLLRELVLSDAGAARRVADALQRSAGAAASALSDASGRLFGAMTMAELQACAAGRPPPAAAAPLSPTPGASPVVSTAADCTDDDATRTRATRAPPGCAEHGGGPNADWGEHLTRLEKGVGHLTLDQTGSLRYLGDSSGWYLINRNLHASEDSPRLTRGTGGELRWPPISANTARDGEPADSAAPAAGADAAASDDDIGRRRRTHSSESAPEAGAPHHRGAPGPGSGAPQPRTGDDQSCVPVPRNLPPCGKPPMPDIDEQIRMLSLYFRHVHPVFPILYKSHFLGRAFDGTKAAIPALMSAVFAAASTYMAREATNKEDLARVRVKMAMHFQRAKMYLDEQYTHNTIASVLTLLLMSVYEQGTMSTRSWLYSGMAIRKAYDLGLHRDVGVAKHKGTTVLSRTDAQIRQRAWWGCYVIDIMVSATLGRPTTIRDFTFDTPYPANYGDDDDELLVGSPMAGDRVPAQLSAHLSNRTHGAADASLGGMVPDAPPHGPADPAQRVAASSAMAERMREYAALTVGECESDGSGTEAGAVPSSSLRSGGRPHGVYYLDLLHILGHILTEMYTCKPHRTYIARYCMQDLHSRADQLIVLDHELRQWKHSLPPELQYPTDDILAARPARCVYVALLHLVYNTAMILLHRPFISRLETPQQKAARGDAAAPDAEGAVPGGGSGGSAPQIRADSSPLPSHSICTVSAQMISLVGQAFIRDSQVVIMPFLTFMMFTAGTMHLNNVIVAADSWVARRFLKRTLDVMSRLGAHWQVSYKCYTMLNNLIRANRIGLDQVSDNSDSEIRAIQTRCRENSRIAREVFEAWSQRHGQSAHSPAGGCGGARSWSTSGEAAMADAPPDPAGSHGGARSASGGMWPPDQKLYVQSADSRRASVHVATAGSAGDDHGAAALSWGRTHGGAGSQDGMSAAGRSGGDWRTPALWLRKRLDANGQLVVPATPYTSVMPPDRPDAMLEPLRALSPTHNSTAAGRGLLQPALASNPAQQTLAGGSSSALGQFVPSLEFFANADYPLGIGGPNGQASATLPQAMAIDSGWAKFAGLGSPGSAASSMSPAAHLLSAAVSSAAAPPLPGLGTAAGTSERSASTDGWAGATVWSDFRPGGTTSLPVGLPADAAATPSDLMPARVGFSGAVINDDVIRNLLFSAPVTFDLGGLQDPAALAKGAPTAGAVPGRVAMDAGAGDDAAWKEYVGQVLRLFGSGGDQISPPAEDSAARRP
ncbi:hypothetical protein LPJ61_000288 [Coemansia biformis]|uniref:Zn(2)-C6 fungal-type domain-containing protein n=1 Tax=Coemansia biformis TaxID=1286918 RepID=A0A9W7YIZ2_9FUNG|nr:hypothetical protein LPJ61_000288 [Coemansia biformis]